MHTSHGQSSTISFGNSLESLAQASPPVAHLSEKPQPALRLVEGMSLDHHEQEGLSPAPTNVSDKVIPPEDHLLIQIHRVPFEKWLDNTDNNKRGKCVLDVAVKMKAASEPRPFQKLSDSLLPSNSSTTDSQEDLGVPVRVAINSELIRIQLNKVTGYDIEEDDKVMQPPWKLIMTNHEGIKKRFYDLEKRAAEKHNKVAIKENEQHQEATVVTGNESTQVGQEFEICVKEGDSSGSQKCEVCDRIHINEGLEVQCLTNTVGHLKCFVQFIDNDLKHVFELRRGLEESTIREIAFEDLWHLFNPGDLLITSGSPHQRQAYKVFYTSGGRPIMQDHGNFKKMPSTTPFRIDCYYIDFDKKWLGPIHQTIKIPRYEGKRPVTELKMLYSQDYNSHPSASAFPIRFLDEPEGAMANLVTRGRRHRELTPFSHKRYCGPSGVEEPEYLNSEIIIDFELEEDNESIGIFYEIVRNSEEVAEGCALHEPCYGCDDIFDDSVVDHDRAVRYKEDQFLLSKRYAGNNDLTDDHLMLLPAVVNAFVLRERDEFGLYVDLVKDLDGDLSKSLKDLKKQSGFEDLVLPEGHSELVEALVRTHRSTRRPRGSIDEEAKVQVDLIEGKGEGLVILLHGVPGVGKTSTAECVAAYTGRPLYPITCANIGLDPEEVEKKLTGDNGHFRRAQQWNCVVLLDEADVFLAKRETRENDAKRNALVSVFLRTLEYYSGILILTTNRVGSFDEAVVSRIQLFLYYPPLDKDKTMKVWRVHIERVRSSGIINIDYDDEDEIMEFAEEEYAEGRRWNGRQIRNFFQTSILLASYNTTKRRQQFIEDGRIDKNSKIDKPRLTTRTLKAVAATSGKFIDYINSTVPDGSHPKQQLDEGNRNDGWEETPKKKR
ncbi:hypothetical protein BKA64DRAFT_157338 [Cadophora sp. MPI-SDFR-AT-0126]|nr:hypothetical protein BKA64DRAFT_157338 [Leotiomycetes sp. MPI-SDFR-AT-0126]